MQLRIVMVISPAVRIVIMIPRVLSACATRLFGIMTPHCSSKFRELLSYIFMTFVLVYISDIFVRNIHEGTVHLRYTQHQEDESAWKVNTDFKTLTADREC